MVSYYGRPSDGKFIPFHLPTSRDDEKTKKKNGNEKETKKEIEIEIEIENKGNLLWLQKPIRSRCGGCKFDVCILINGVTS